MSKFDSTPQGGSGRITINRNPKPGDTLTINCGHALRFAGAEATVQALAERINRDRPGLKASVDGSSVVLVARPKTDPIDT